MPTVLQPWQASSWLADSNDVKACKYDLLMICKILLGSKTFYCLQKICHAHIHT